MSKHTERPQKDAPLVDPDELKPLHMRPLTSLGDRKHNPRDLEPDEAAMRNGIEHGGSVETRAEYLSVRGSGGRKRSGARGRYKAGRDMSKRR